MESWRGPLLGEEMGVAADRVVGGESAPVRIGEDEGDVGELAEIHGGISEVDGFRFEAGLGAVIVVGGEREGTEDLTGGGGQAVGGFFPETVERGVVVGVGGAAEETFLE